MWLLYYFCLLILLVLVYSWPSGKTVLNNYAIIFPEARKILVFSCFQCWRKPVKLSCFIVWLQHSWNILVWIRFGNSTLNSYETRISRNNILESWYFDIIYKPAFEPFLEVTKSRCFRVPWGSCSTDQQPRASGTMWGQKDVANEKADAAVVSIWEICTCVPL